MVSGVFTAVVVFALWVVSTANSAPNINQLSPRVPGQTSEILASNNQSLGDMASQVLRTQVTQPQQPQLLRQATVAIEDRRFYQHGGVDYEGLFRAAVRDVLHGGGIQGGSTLTMQLVTNVYLPDNIKDSHNLKYKIVQAKLATELENQESKNQILTQYLNDVAYGTENHETAIGVAAASQMFFDKPLDKLDLAQIALLAGLPQAPTTYNPFANPTLAKWRRGEVLQAMVQSGYITRAEAQTAGAQGLQVKQNDQYQQVRQPYVVDYVEQQLDKVLTQRELDQGGLKVYTTINLADQQAAADAIKANEGQPGDPAASLVSIDPTTGDIVALQNSTNVRHRQGRDHVRLRHSGPAADGFVIQAVRADDHDQGRRRRSEPDLLRLQVPGSGMAPRLSDLFGPHSRGELPGHDQRDQGDGAVRQHGLRATGRGRRHAERRPTAKAMGITAPLTGNPAEAIGGLHIGVDTLQMSDAYATLANGGDHVAPTIISKVDRTARRSTPPPRRRLRSSPRARPTPGRRRSRRSCSTAPVRAPTTAARRRARRAPPATTPTPGSSATPRSSRRRSGSAIRNPRST